MNQSYKTFNLNREVHQWERNSRQWKSSPHTLHCANIWHCKASFIVHLLLLLLIFCHFMKLILSWLLITVFLINFLSWRKTSPQKHNDCFQICKIVTHCRNKIAFSIETLLSVLVTRSFWEISFILHAVESKKRGSEAYEKPLIIKTENQNIGKS